MPSVEDPKSELAELLQRRYANDLAIAQAVVRCRQASYSWAAIGTMLGTSRQAAWERYGSINDDATT